MARHALVAMLFGCVLLAGSGCQTGNREVRTMPVTGEYREVEQADMKEAMELVSKAERCGTPYGAPYEYTLASEYLRMGGEEGWERLIPLRASTYPALAKDMAEAALRRGSVLEDGGARAEPKSESGCREELERIKARYQRLGKEKAIEVAPVIYARVTADLTQAEYALQGRQWQKAWRGLSMADVAMDTILAQDQDKDGVADMSDTAPLEPEDKDDFEDEDGAPDLDNDRDGVPDCVDAHPNEPETKNHWKDEDGAPDTCPGLEPVRFGGSSVALSEGAEGYLRGVRLILAEWPELELHIAGHCGATDEARAMDLSRQRAEAVQRYVAGLGVPATQLLTTFHGSGQKAEDSVTLTLE